MPELPEVERGRRLAESVAAGRRIERVACAEDAIVYAGVPAAAWEALRGRRVLAACRWGKQLWLDLDAPPHPLFHFGMSGGFRVPGDTPLKLASGPCTGRTSGRPATGRSGSRSTTGGSLS